MDDYKLFQIRECIEEIDFYYDAWGDEPDMPQNILDALNRAREKLSRLDPTGRTYS